MFKKITLENFKGFAKKQSIELKPITLIYGANSSGKSSILQSLLLLKQTLEQSNDKSAILLSKGKYVDLGNYNEFINAHDSEKKLLIKLKLPPFKAQLQYFPKEEPEKIESSVEIIFSHENVLEIESFSIYIEDDIIMTLSRTSDDIKTHRYFYFFPRAEEQMRKKKVNFEISNINVNSKFYSKLIQNIISEFPSNFKKDIFNHRLGLLDIEIEKDVSYKAYQKLKNIIENDKRNELNEEISKYFKKFIFNFTNFLPNINMVREESFSLFDKLPRDCQVILHIESLFNAASDIITDILEKMYYIGPLRKNPERYYVSSGNVSNYVGKTGLESPDILYENENNILNTTNKWLKKFTNYTLKPTNTTRKTKNTGTQNVYSLRLIDNTTKMNVNITDVGFGISQILPIIVQAFMEKSSTIVIEQPEIHIHPKLQAELGSMLAEACKNNMFIIETHSENLLLRLKKLVRNKKLDKNKLSIVYVDKTKQGSICYPIRLDDNGDFIDKWPKGFFEESFEELF